MALNPFDTTLGTGPASWYPVTPTANNAAAAPPASVTDPLAQAQALGIAPPTTPTAPSPELLPPNVDTPSPVTPGLTQLLRLAKTTSGSISPDVANGLGAALGGLNLYSGVANKNPLQATAGGLTTAGALNNLAPSVANSILGDSGVGSSLGLGANGAGLSGAGAVGAGLGGIGGLLGLGSGIAGLINGTATPMQSILNLGSGALGTYGALSTVLPDIFPSIGSILAPVGSAIAEVLPTAVTGAVSSLAGTIAPILAEANPATLAVSLPTAIFSLIGALSGEGWGNIGDMFGAGEAGRSKYLGLSRTAESQAADISTAQMGSAEKAAQQSGDINSMTPTQLSNLGNLLMGGETSYYRPMEMGFEPGAGASSYLNPAAAAKRPAGYQSYADAMAPYNTGMNQLKAINARLVSMGQPGIAVPSVMAAATGAPSYADWAMGPGAAYAGGYSPSNPVQPTAASNAAYQKFVNDYFFNQYEQGQPAPVPDNTTFAGTA